MRRAVRMSLRFWGDARANSKAVDRPMPDEAPAIRTVLPLRELGIVAMLKAGIVSLVNNSG